MHMYTLYVYKRDGKEGAWQSAWGRGVAIGTSFETESKVLTHVDDLVTH